MVGTVLSPAVPHRPGYAAVLATGHAAGMGRRAVHARYQRTAALQDRGPCTRRYPSAALLHAGPLLDRAALVCGIDCQGQSLLLPLGVGGDGPAAPALVSGCALSRAVFALTVSHPVRPDGALLHAATVSRMPGVV